MPSKTVYKWLLLAVMVWGVCSSIDFIHHSNEAVENYLKDVNQQYPAITKLYSIGKSGGGVDLWVLAIGKDIDSYVPLRPHVKYIGNMHGNEAISREVLLHLIEYFVTSYGTNSTIQSFLNSTVVHIMPSMNPDGYARAVVGECDGIIGRYNLNNTDLNRNFPDPWHNLHATPIVIETQHVMNWLPTRNFVLSANLHGGALVANYPFDQHLDGHTGAGVESKSPDDETFRFLSLTYSRSHGKMASTNGKCSGSHYTFKDGVTNGAEWYPVAGGMQDYNYLMHGIFELTLELSCCKFPLKKTLQPYWIDNKDALVNYLLETHRGVKGIVRDENNNTMTNVNLVVVGRELVPFKSRNYGEYFRVLLPGTYELQVIADGYKPVTKSVIVPEGVTRVDITLELINKTTDSTNSAIPMSQGYASFFVALVVTFFML